MGEIDWKSPVGDKVAGSIRCPHCGSELVKPLDPAVMFLEQLVFHCAACGADSDFDEVIEAAVAECFSADSYLAMTDGGDQPVTTCYECTRDTFVLSEGQCLACGKTLSFTECVVCGASIGPDDQDKKGLCNYHAWQAEKAD